MKPYSLFLFVLVSFVPLNSKASSLQDRSDVSSIISRVDDLALKWEKEDKERQSRTVFPKINWSRAGRFIFGGASLWGALFALRKFRKKFLVVSRQEYHLYAGKKKLIVPVLFYKCPEHPDSYLFWDQIPKHFEDWHIYDRLEVEVSGEGGKSSKAAGA